MGARPSPQRPASIRTTTSSVPGLPWIVMASVLCRSRSVENRPGMPSTWSKWACVSKSRSSLLKPAPLLSSWRCVPSPQSIMMRCPPASTRSPGWLRSAEGTLADVPRKVRSNIAREPPRSSFLLPKTSSSRFLDRKTGTHELIPSSQKWQTADPVEQPAGVDDVGGIALALRQLPVSHVVAERRTRLEVEDAVQLIEQRLAHHLEQVAAVIGDDRIEAAVLFGRVVATLRRIGSSRLQDMPQARLQLRDEQNRCCWRPHRRGDGIPPEKSCAD